jgi:hypothetical protein
MHRFNFLRQMDQSVKTLQAAMALSLVAIRICGSQLRLELRARIRQANPGAPEARFAMRLRAWLARLHEVPRFGRSDAHHWPLCSTAAPGAGA